MFLRDIGTMIRILSMLNNVWFSKLSRICRDERNIYIISRISPIFYIYLLTLSKILRNQDIYVVRKSVHMTLDVAMTLNPSKNKLGVGDNIGTSRIVEAWLRYFSEIPCQCQSYWQWWMEIWVSMEIRHRHCNLGLFSACFCYCCTRSLASLMYMYGVCMEVCVAL